MFLIIPTGVDYHTKRMPVVTFTLIGLNTLVYLAYLVLALSADSAAKTDWFYQTFWLVPAQSKWWMFITAMFVHGGFFHLFGNMIYLFLFGASLEDKLGRVMFTVFYLVGGLA